MGPSALSISDDSYQFRESSILFNMTSAQQSIPTSIEEAQAGIARLKLTEQKLLATAQKYTQKMQRSRKWNLFAVVLALIVCVVAWVNHASPLLRWGMLPAVLFMVLFFEGMRRLMGLTMQSSLRQLRTQISGLEAQLAAGLEAQAKKDQA